jgi:hypothetical protein
MSAVYDASGDRATNPEDSPLVREADRRGDVTSIRGRSSEPVNPDLPADPAFPVCSSGNGSTWSK